MPAVLSREKSGQSIDFFNIFGEKKYHCYSRTSSDRHWAVMLLCHSKEKGPRSGIDGQISISPHWAVQVTLKLQNKNSSCLTKIYFKEVFCFFSWMPGKLFLCKNIFCVDCSQDRGLFKSWLPASQIVGLDFPLKAWGERKKGSAWKGLLRSAKANPDSSSRRMSILALYQGLPGSVSWLFQKVDTSTTS